MARRRTVWIGMFTGAAILVLAQARVQAQGHTLKEDSLEGECFHMRLEMDLKGKITVKREGKSVAFTHNATARHDFVERVLQDKDGIAVKTARHYHRAEATFSDGTESERRALRSDLALLMAQRVKDRTVVHHAKHNLTQRELELTEHFDTLHLAGLLPAKEVAPGESWSVSVPIVQALCHFDGLIEQDLTAKLEAVKADVAHISVIGKARGIDMGTEVHVLVKAKAEFDTKKKRLTSLTWQQSDQREQGPVSPALSADLTIKLTREPIPQPDQLNNFALVPFPEGAPPEGLTVLNYRDEKSRFSFQHSRDWHLVGVQDEQVVLRLLDRGDFVAQVTFTPWKKAAPEKMLTIEQFADLMNEAPAWQVEKLLEKTEKVDVPGKTKVQRVSAEGTLSGQKVVQFFYLVGSEQGEQMIVTFTMKPEQVQKLAARDMALVRSVRLESMLTATAQRKP